MGAKDQWEQWIPLALEQLKEVVKAPPYSIQGAAYDRLDRNDAIAQNLNYRDVLRTAKEWLTGWSPQVFSVIFAVPLEESRTLQNLIDQRLNEIAFILRGTGDQS